MLRSRVALAVIGVLIFGGIAAALGAASAYYPADATSSAPTSVAQSASPLGDATASVTSTSTPTAVQASPTAIATRTPRPTPTPPPIGVVIDLHGRISSVGTATAGTFVLRVYGGASYTVQTSTSTTYTGTANSFATLQAGMEATVTGMFPAANTAFQATQVNTQPGGN